MELQTPLQLISETFATEKISIVKYGAGGVSLAILMATAFSAYMSASRMSAKSSETTSSNADYQRAPDQVSKTERIR
jgi:hypothetical protein